MSCHACLFPADSLSLDTPMLSPLPQVLDYFDNSWMITEVLFSALQGAHRRRRQHGRRQGLSGVVPLVLVLLEACSGCQLHCLVGWLASRCPAAALNILRPPLASSPAGEECFYRPPYHNLRHPFIFYYGHVAVSRGHASFLAARAARGALHNPSLSSTTPVAHRRCSNCHCGRYFTQTSCEWRAS